jgi:hypothetical protein
MSAVPDRTQCFPSAHHRFPQGVITIVGGLLILSLILLLTGATPAQAQPGRADLCAGFSGPARGLCTAAVSAGCFEGVQSQDCDALGVNWTTHCPTCPAGTPPWVATCPCSFALAPLLTAIAPTTVTCATLSVSTPDTVIMLIGANEGASIRASMQYAPEESSTLCRLSRDNNTIEFDDAITQAEFDACVTDSIQTVADINVPCQ